MVGAKISIIEEEEGVHIIRQEIVLTAIILYVAYAKNMAMTSALADLDAEGAEIQIIPRDCYDKNNAEKSATNYSEEKLDNGQVFYSCVNVQHGFKDIWFVDSACSNHMTSSKEMFV